jgi:hypothetical protein
VNVDISQNNQSSSMLAKVQYETPEKNSSQRAGQVQRVKSAHGINAKQRRTSQDRKRERLAKMANENKKSENEVNAITNRVLAKKGSQENHHNAGHTGEMVSQKTLNQSENKFLVSEDAASAYRNSQKESKVIDSSSSQRGGGGKNMM